MGDCIEDWPQFAKHQESGKGQALLSRRPIPRKPADRPKEFMIIIVIPRVRRFGAAESVPVGPEGIAVQVILGEMWQQLCIAGFFDLLGNHPFYRGFVADVIPGEIPAVCPGQGIFPPRIRVSARVVPVAQRS